MNSYSVKAHILLSLLLFFYAPSSLQAAVNYSVTPRVIDLSAEARDIIERKITITNNANYTSSIFPSVNEISLNEGGDITDFKGPTMVDRTSSITTWLEVARKEINIPKGESYELPVTIRMNPNTQPGEYHALIGFGSGRNRDEAEKLVREGRAPGVVVTIRVEDTAVEHIDLKGFVVDKFITNEKNQAARYVLTNPGDTVVVPQGEIIFYDNNGKEVGSINANPEQISLEPGQEIELKTQVPTDGLLGKYKAFLSVNYGTEQIASVYDTEFFYVIPWKKLLFVFVILLLTAIILTIFLYKKYSIDEEDDDVHHLQFKFKEGSSELKDHDINLKKKNSTE